MSDYIEGWAFKEGEDELRDANQRRYREIAHLESEKHVLLVRRPDYGRCEFDGELLSEEAQELSPKDIALLADHGNLCFGGTCRVYGDGKFRGTYNTD